jgi:hypothetical protein
MECRPGMSEIQDRGHPGPVKSRPIQFTGTGKKAPFTSVLTSVPACFLPIINDILTKKFQNFNGPVMERNEPKNASIGTDFFRSTTV